AHVDHASRLRIHYLARSELYVYELEIVARDRVLHVRSQRLYEIIKLIQFHVPQDMKKKGDATRMDEGAEREHQEPDDEDPLQRPAVGDLAKDEDQARHDHQIDGHYPGDGPGISGEILDDGR